MGLAQVTDPFKAEFIKVMPAEHRGVGELCPLQRNPVRGPRALTRLTRSTLADEPKLSWISALPGCARRQGAPAAVVQLPATQV